MSWNDFIRNPIVAELIEEAQAKQLESVDSDEDPALNTKDVKDMDIEELAKGYAEGNVQEEELAKLYQSGALSRDDIQAIMSAADPNAQEQQAQAQMQPEVSQEELMAQQIDQVNDSFIRFSLFDRINELQEKLENLIENFSDYDSELYLEVKQTTEFVKILSGLVFSLDVSVLYQMYGSIEMRLIELFTEYVRLNPEEPEEDQTKEIDFSDETKSYEDSPEGEDLDYSEGN